MGPTPEPVPSGGLSDEEMPQQPPIVLSSSDDDDDEEEVINPDYPPGYMPIAYHVQIQWDSEDSDVDSEPTPPPPPPRPLPPDAADAPDTGVQAEQAAVHTDEAATDNAIDYNSLAGLMAAFAAHGPNQAEEPCGLQTAYLNDSEAPTSGPPRPRRRPLARHTDSNRPVATTPTTANTAAPTAASTIAQTDLSLKAPEEDRLPLAPEQEAAVLRAMQGFTLPASAIPAWASDLPDTAITTLVRDKLGRPSANENN